MAELSPLEERLGEVLGLAQAAQTATRKVAKLVEQTDTRPKLEAMRADAVEAADRCRATIDGIDGKKIAITKKARETKRDAEQMMEIYLADDADALEGMEFLVMAEAGELGHWAILREINEGVGVESIRELTAWGIPIQEGHFAEVMRCSLETARRGS